MKVFLGAHLQIVFIVEFCNFHPANRNQIDMKFTNQKFLILLLFFPLFFAVACSKEETPEEGRTYAMELEELDQFISEKLAEGFDIDTTSLGAFYIIYEEGTGPYPEAYDICVMEYIAFLPDGTEFDATRDYSDNKWEFIFEYDQSLPTGFNDAIELMNEGTEIEVIVPSPLAWGKQGTSKVPPYTTVIYLATMHEVRPQ